MYLKTSTHLIINYNMSHILQFIRDHNITNHEQFRERLPGCVTVRTHGRFVLLCTRDVPLTDPNLSVFLECNGTIFERLTTESGEFQEYRLVCLGLTHSVDYADYLKVHSKESLNFDDFMVEPCVDGTLIRLWYTGNGTDGHWQLSTSRKIDASQAFWSSGHSFAELFWQICPFLDLDTLNKNYCYSFVIRHPQIMQVLPVAHPSVLHVGTRDLNSTSDTFLQELPEEEVTWTWQLNQNEPVTPSVNVLPKPGPLNETIDSLEKFEEYVRGLDTGTRGLLLKHRTGPLRLKSDSALFTEMSQVRGNVPNLAVRYLQLLNDPVQLEKLQTFYPEWAGVFAGVRHQISLLAQMIQDAYYHTRVAKTPDFPHNPRYTRTLVQLHGQYKASIRNGNRQHTTPDVVEAKLKSLPSHVLGWLLEWW